MLMYVMSFSAGSDRKESACNERDPGMIPGSGRSREGNGYPLQYSCLGNPMDRGAWLTAVHGVVKGRTGRSDFHSLVQIKSHDGTNSNITHQG